MTRVEGNDSILLDISCDLCGYVLRHKHLVSMYAHLYQAHLHSFVCSMLLVPGGNSLPNCVQAATTMHACYYDNAPLNLNEVARIMHISHCIATAHVPSNMHEVILQFFIKRSDLYASNNDFEQILTRVKSLLPDLNVDV